MLLELCLELCSMVRLNKNLAFLQPILKVGFLCRIKIPKITVM